MLSLTVAFACSIFSPTKTDAFGFDSARLAAIPARLQKLIDAEEIAGTVVLVQRNGNRVLLDARGMANRESEVPMKPGTIFQVMSMTKPVTAIAVMICAERGLLNLDDTVETFVPALSRLTVRQSDGSTLPKRGRITIRHLLTHTAGFASSDPGGLDDEEKTKLKLSDYVDRMPDTALIAEPGDRISYSGPGIALAGRIVEIVTGTPLQDFMQKEIFGRLGMPDTAFFLDPKKEARLAHVYAREKSGLQGFGGNPMRPGAKYANPAGGLYSTASDMANLIQCIANGGEWRGVRLLSPRSVATMTTLQTGSLLSDGTDAQGYGLGFSVVRGAGGTMSLKSIGTFGHTGAFCTEYWADPRTGVVAVFLSQSFSDRVRKTFNTMVNAAFVGP